MRLTISICATKNYSYAVGAQATAVQACISEYRRLAGEIEPIFILVSDSHEKMLNLGKWYEANIPGCSVFHLSDEKFEDNHKNYKEKAQNLIATMRTLAFNKAKSLNPDYHWSLDSDVIPRCNFLHIAEGVLKLDDGYYGMAVAPYPSQGAGGPFLTGFGSPQRQIFPNVYPDEFVVPAKISRRLKQYKRELLKLETKLKGNKKNNEPLLKDARVISSKIRRWEKFIEKRLPAKGNVFFLNSKRYRQRGWQPFEQAFAQGTMALRCDWAGLGCNLFSQKALNLSDFNGYRNLGTEDLFLIYSKLLPHGIKIATIPHCISDHICRVRSGRGDDARLLYKHVFVFFETEGDCIGHARMNVQDFVEFNLL